MKIKLNEIKKYFFIVLPLFLLVIIQSPSKAFASFITGSSAVSSDFTVYGTGWDGPGLGSASLSYYLGAMSTDLDVTLQQNTIRLALGIWGSYANLSFTEVFVPNLTNSLDIFFVPGSHFESSGTLAHAYYPAPDPNEETLAGDVHINDNYFWEIGDDPAFSDGKYDLLWVTVHELGHSLGLAHSTVSGSVMFASVHMDSSFSQLGYDDILGIQSLYAVPEPSTLILVFSGLFGLIYFKKQPTLS